MPPSAAIKPIAEERAFSFDELFFSTTDKRGVIRFGNDVFCRIADYSLGDMTGQPHNIIRHPDMPRAAFQLVWDYLNRNEMVAAYVKNLAHDGRYYWVLALIMPTEDGYLSIRLKPSSDFFPIVKKAYADVLEVELRAEAEGNSRKDAIKAGVDRMVQLLGGLGFASYDEFMWAALPAEMTSRESHRGSGLQNAVGEPQYKYTGAPVQRTADRERLVALMRKSMRLDQQLCALFSKPGTFTQMRDQIIPKSDFILRLGNAIRLLSINAEVEAAKLGSAGAALGMVAERLGSHAVEGIATISRLNTRLHTLTAPISKLIFNSLVSKIQIEMTASFVGEILAVEPGADTADTADAGDAGCNDLLKSVDLLTETFLGTARQILPSLDQLLEDLGRVDREINDLRKFMRTLRFIYFTGKIETARHSDAASFTTIFEQVKSRIGESDVVLDEFLEMIEANITDISTIGNLDDRMFDELDALIAA